MKHGEHIVAFEKDRFGKIASPFNFMPFNQFKDQAGGSLVIMRRAELETDERYGQLLPYIVLFQRSKVSGNLKFFTYQRGKGIGESRLAGAYSIGVGGHVDLNDALHASTEESAIDFDRLIDYAIRRELGEEINIATDEIGDRLLLTYLDGHRPIFAGIINDASDPVGRVHYGALFFLEVPPIYTISCSEPELETIGMFGADDLKQAKADMPLESWSRIVLGLNHAAIISIIGGTDAGKR